MCKILGRFVNSLTDNGKYSFLNRDNLLQQLQIQISQKEKTFSHSFFHFGNLDSISNFVEKKVTLIADVFLNLLTPERG